MCAYCCKILLLECQLILLTQIVKFLFRETKKYMYLGKRMMRNQLLLGEERCAYKIIKNFSVKNCMPMYMYTYHKAMYLFLIAQIMLLFNMIEDLKCTVRMRQKKAR